MVVLKRLTFGQPERKSSSESSGTSVDGIYVSGFNLIGQRSRDVIGRLSVSRDVIGCEDCAFRSVFCYSKVRGSIVSKMSIVFLFR